MMSGGSERVRPQTRDTIAEGQDNGAVSVFWKVAGKDWPETWVKEQRARGVRRWKGCSGETGRRRTNPVLERSNPKALK